jgi:Carboxypeptidase regulatory-like domain
LCFGAHTAEATAEIAGSLAEATSDPAGFANVTFVHAQSGPRRAAVADVHGNYRLARLSAGSYTVTARSVRSGDNVLSRV